MVAMPLAPNQFIFIETLTTIDMKKLQFFIATLLLILGLSCSKVENGDLEPDGTTSSLRTSATSQVAFYLLKSYQMLPNKCAVDLKSVVLADRPLVSQADIISYDDKTFTYTVSANAYTNGIKQLRDGTPIAICLDKTVLFASIFKPLTSSSTCYHSITMQALPNNQVKFQLGYPTLPNGVVIDDQRNNASLVESLKIAKKLNVKFSCVNNAANQSLLVSEVKSKIYGEWKLEGLITNRPNQPIPDIKVVFKDILGAPIDKQVADVYLNCKLAYTTTYFLRQINGGVKSVNIVPDKKIYKSNEPAVVTGNVRICDSELRINTGFTTYLFSKVNTAACLLKPDAGICLAAFQRFYYDPVEKRCKAFNWGGCGGVVPFETLEACKACECNK
jgi:Kunitz/Bovine pancreatic trypsin inhibitor domain